MSKTNGLGGSATIPANAGCLGFSRKLNSGISALTDTPQGSPPSTYEPDSQAPPARCSAPYKLCGDPENSTDRQLALHPRHPIPRRSLGKPDRRVSPFTTECCAQ